MACAGGAIKVVCDEDTTAVVINRIRRRRRTSRTTISSATSSDAVITQGDMAKRLLLQVCETLVGTVFFLLAFVASPLAAGSSAINTVDVEDVPLMLRSTPAIHCRFADAKMAVTMSCDCAERQIVDLSLKLDEWCDDLKAV